MVIGSSGRFLAGAMCPLRAVMFVLRHPSVWPYLIAPVIVNVAVVVTVWHYSGEYGKEWLNHHLYQTGWIWQALHYAAIGVMWVLRLLASLCTFVVIGNLACVPFNDFLSERVDTLASGWRDMRRLTVGQRVFALLFTLKEEIKRVSVFVVLSVLLFALTFFVVIAPVVVVAQFLLSAGFFATEYLSFPLERRGVLALRDKLRFRNRNVAACFGFGAVMSLTALIPLVNFFFIPIGVVGGTLLHARLAGGERPEGT